MIRSLFILFTLLSLAACQVKTSSDSSPVATTTKEKTTITATTNVLADGVATSFITINITKLGAAVVGVVPTFSSTGTSNTPSACSASDSSGNSTCTLSSTKAEVKTLKVLTPQPSTTVTSTFIAGAPVAGQSTITGISPAVANGTLASPITITLKDQFANPVSGFIPTFSATNTGSTNIYGACTSSSSSGVSTCTLKSLKSEIKTLQLLTPVSVTGGTVVFVPAVPSAAHSTITGTGPVAADGIASSVITITLNDASNNAVIGVTPVFAATNTGNTNVYGACSATNVSGVSTCSLKSATGELKTLSITSPVSKSDGTVLFTGGATTVSAANSSIIGSSPVIADGVATSTITITLKDTANNPVAGQTPTFGATDTGGTNVMSACSPSDVSGISLCTLKSTKAEIKALSIVTPVVKIGGNVTFIAGSASALTSVINGSSPVLADGAATSAITINLKDAYGNAVAGQTPTFSATDTGATNVASVCSVSDASGNSSCTLSSLKAESKTLQLLTPVSVAGGIVIFNAGAPVAANSNIIGTSPVVADGTATSDISITLRDFYLNPVAGQLPTFSATDTNGTNVYGVCGLSDALGVSVCTLKSLKAETKTLSILTPVMKTDGDVTFTAAGPSAANSTISASGPVVADGVATSTVTITLKDGSNNPVPGLTPTFAATDTGTTNDYGSCSATDGSGVSTCTFTSTKAETKTMSIVTPVAKPDGTVIFTAGAAVAVNTTITGSGPTIADGVATSTISATFRDAYNNLVSGITPTFEATDTGSSNSYGACSASDASGVSTCSLSSLKAEVKTLNLTAPFVKSDGSVTFIAGAAVAANSSISGTGTVTADGLATSSVTVTLKDINNNDVSGVVPTFSATDTGATNVYGVCSATDASGIATCTLSSLQAETKTLSIATPVVKADGTVVFTAGATVAANSSISGTGPVVANGVATSTVTITLKDAANNPVPGQTPTFGATDTGLTNSYAACSATDASGISTCTFTSTKAEIKTLGIVTPVVKAGGTVAFIAGAAVAGNSTIIGSGPVVADGSATSAVTITLKDAFNNLVSGTTPTFGATDTGSTNSYSGCSASDASGISNCTMTSLKSEVKTLSITAPFLKADGTVTFTAGAPVAANSSISGTSPVVADGSATSTVTINFKDVNNNNVSGVTPTFSATDTGATNAYGSCAASDASGNSVCTLTSLAAETKTLSITTPVVKAGGTVVFTAGAPVAANSTISGTGPVIADGVDSSTVTITLKDAANNPVAGQTPTFGATDTGASNAYAACSASDASGVSTCSFTSTKAETKTLAIATPVVKPGTTVVFNAGSAVASNSTITGTSPVVADGVATSTVTITFKDAFDNLVSGVASTFSATDTGTTNSYGACSTSGANGEASCTLSSLKAENKTLSIASPFVKAGGSVLFTAGSPVAANSSISGTSPVVADGVATSTVTINLKDVNNNNVSGATPTFSATDTSSTNSYGSCSASDANGDSICTLASVYAEVKTLAIATPVSKTGATVTFTAGAAVAANSSISGTGPVVADGAATSTVTITLKDAANNPVAGQTPTFGATDSGSTNAYAACSVSDASGISTCTFTSTKAETKTLAIATPVVKAGSTVVFNAGSAVAATSTITGSGPVVANGSSSSTVTITLKDAFNNLVSGTTPTFSATDTGTTNTHGSCSASNASGVSTCSMTSLKAEVKTLSIATPFVKTDGSVTFIAGAAVAANSSISGTGPVSADGSSTSTVTINLKDVNNNEVSGVTPTFSATDTGSTNTYGTCSASDASGNSTCTLASTNAETKTLSIATPIVKVGGAVVFTPGSPVAANSSISGSGPVIADGIATSTVTITLKDAGNNPVPGQTPTFGATDTGTTNTYGTCSASDASGISTCTFTSTKAETKTLAIATPVVKTGGTVVFTAGAAVAATSTITGTGPVLANGSAASTITITLKDAYNNLVSGTTPTFTATDTGSTNNHGSCSVSNASGVSTCSLTSLKAEVKTLSIATPFIKADGTVTFTAGSPVAANSSISGTGPVSADGTSTSTVTINLKDVNSNNVSGVVPTFSATDTGTTNVYGICSSSDASGNSTCTLKSTVAETKTLSIATPFVKAGGTVVFTAGAPVAANSSITGTGPVVANGTATSTVTITLKDAGNNPVSGQVPTFGATNTGTTNTYGTCSSSDASGISTCTLKSLRAETKTLAIATPVAKTGGTVVFTAGTPVASTSTITGTGPVAADGTATSTVTITLRDVNNNLVSGTTPTFSATNTGAGNTYGTCSASDASGISTCTLRSTKAESKTLSIATPFVKAGGTVVFTAGSPSVANSDIVGTTPVSADGVSVSFITISLNDANANPVAGVTPIFNATDTNSTNAYGACSVTDASGVSLCTLSSTKAEVKTLQLTSPIAVTGSTTVTFSSSLPTAANSSIAGTGPVVADGSADSTVTITLRDGNNNPVAGIEPVFDATNTGAGNTYDDCSLSDAGGVSICTFNSTKAEVKTLRITSPVTKTGGTVTFTAGPAAIATSSIAGTGPVVADNVATSTMTITLKDANNNIIAGTTPTFTATNTGSGNTQTACSATNSSGIATCTLKSTKAESKIPSIATPIVKAGSAIIFTAGSAVAANSTITGSSPVNPDGSSTSTITITLKDNFSNNVSGVVPTFSATGSNNNYGTCSATNSSGVATCTLASTTGETKTLSIATPVVKAGGTVLFQSGSAVAANSSITGTGPVTANGTSTSTVTITLKDSGNAPVVGIVPTFSGSGTNNNYGTCSATNSSGVSTCTLSSIKAESKTLSIDTPVIKLGGTVVFNPGTPSAAMSTIEAADDTLADGVEECLVTVTIKDANGNAISGQTPTYAMTGTNNTLGSCSATDSAGESNCTVTSTKAQAKTVSLLTPVAVPGNTVDFNPEGINIQVPIEMADRGLASATTAVTFNRSRTSLDPNDYEAEFNDYIFEIVANNTNTTTAYQVTLIDSAGVQITTANISVPANSSYRRLRVNFTPNAAADNYRVRISNTASNSQVIVHSAKIIVEQTKAIATKIYIPLIGGDVTGDVRTDTTASTVSSTTSTTFLQPVASNFYLWDRTDSAYDTVVASNAWTLETVSSISNAAGTVSAALFDKTNNQQITPAITTHTGNTTITMKQVTFDSTAANFNDGDKMELRMRSSSTSYTAYLYKAGLWVKLKYLKKAEIFQRLVNRRSATTSGGLPDGRFLYDAGAWSNPTVYLQTNANVATSSITLQNHGVNDNGTTSPTTVSGSTITPTATYSIQRTGALTLTDMNRYYVQHNRTSGTVVLGGAFMVIRAQE